MIKINRVAYRFLVNIFTCFVLISGQRQLFGYSFKKVTILASDANVLSYRGPASVVRSLLTGLRKMGVLFNCNPATSNEYGEVVIVLSNFDYLRRAIQLKRMGKVKKLIAGPNIVSYPEEANYIAASPEIDRYIQPSLWAKLWFLEVGSNFRIAIWPAGVDSEYWKPNENQVAGEKKNVLVYIKGAPREMAIAVENLLRKYGWQPLCIHYGSYTVVQYKDALLKSKIAVFLGGTESQGIALAEAWAMDVPTLVYNTRKLFYRGRQFSMASFCPYLTDKTGIDWRELDELEGLIKAMPYYLDVFSPREWVLNNMTDEVCAKKMLDIVEACFC